MSKRKTYIVTERAGDWVAGQRKPASGRLLLTDSQAAYELRLGTIKLLEVAEAPKAKRRSRARK